MTSAKTTPSNDAAGAKSLDDIAAETTRSVYAEFKIWNDRKSPKWHPIKKMRYVFYRMINGCTITDALKEIHWTPSEFWHLIELKRNDPFREEYQRAKRLQGRAFGDSVAAIAEGRDQVTKRSLVKMKKLIKKHLIRAGKQKSAMAAKAVIESLMAQINENDSKIIARNKIQIDAAKWLAKSVNPAEFSEKTSLALSGEPTASGEATPIIIQFVGPDGRVVMPT